ncbi:tRNA-splicing endonuclease subunit Sen2 isoform X4 [Syngnathus acus]|uniref:tRNA-splicing endonuclease subunit Sen2 isoform X4 n=1 Tax=Syngnathus acus TaxID=161584 RepID=UPI0018864A13|nr:tRNA-splicing endonuclease subunit Sen2 isoform X4 [Syngnathus acus]
MFQADFRPPRGRCRVDEDYVAPLPVSRSSSQTTGVTSPTTTSRFRADLVNRHVLVTEPEHIRDLHNQGYFGKGVLSRARPEHGVSDRWQQHEGFLLPVVTQARYEELLGRAESSLLAQGLAQVVVNQTLLWLRQPIRADVLRREAEDGEAARSDTLANLRSEPGGSMLRELGPASSPDLRPDRGANSEPDDAPLVPGPGFVIIDAGHVAAQLRRNPLRMTEFLELGLEEAFFLVYSLGCLSVHEQQQMAVLPDKAPPQMELDELVALILIAEYCCFDGPPLASTTYSWGAAVNHRAVEALGGFAPRLCQLLRGLPSLSQQGLGPQRRKRRQVRRGHALVQERSVLLPRQVHTAHQIKFIHRVHHKIQVKLWFSK